MDIEPVLEVRQPIKLSEIKPIEVGRNQMVKERSQLQDLVELPLLSACQELYDKNVRTLSSSANKRDIAIGETYIIVDFDSLSSQNQEVAKQLADIIEYDRMRAVKIKIPVGKNTLVNDIQRKAKEIVDRFKKQPMTWAPTYTLKQLRKFYGIDEGDEHYGVEVFEAETWYYDEEEKLFYLSREHYQKAKEEVNE